MPTKIRKSALELFAQSFARTHRKGKVSEAHLTTAIAAIDAKIKDPNLRLVLHSGNRSILSNEVVAIMNFLTIHDNKPSIQVGRAHLVTLSTDAHDVVVISAVEDTIVEDAGTIEVTATSTQNDTLTYLWSQTDGPDDATITDEDTAVVSVADLVTGTYVFSVTVTDGEGNTATDTIDVVVEIEEV